MIEVDNVLTKIAGWFRKKAKKARKWVTGSEVSVSVQSFALSGGLIVVNVVYWPFWMLEKVAGGITKGLKYPRKKLLALVKSRTKKVK